MAKRKITPHKGGRFIRKSTNVTPEVDQMLSFLWKEHKISLGDLVSMAAQAIYEDKKS